ncbi:MAG TPA: [acyl-carrier-protein] S-malonyltransferase [Chloroflexi bacterium]|nr:[acyl-carrier-protein] S-malonyltransferase [Chloroflexota bacterium]
MIASAYLFPGQGSQHVGMGRELYTRFPVARAVFEQANTILGLSLTRLCFEGPAESLNDTLNTQPAILTTSVAALRALEEQGSGDGPSFVAGHSMGEFSALVAANALSFQDGLMLVRERGRLMKQAGEQNPGGMAAILGLDRAALEAICAEVQEESGEYVGVANDNCPGQVVISGAAAALERAMELAQAQGAKRTVRLAVSIAAHSPFMAEAATEFRRLLEATTFRPPAVPLVANATATPLTAADEIREALGRQLTSPVQWTDSVRWMIAQGVSRFVEFGPQDVLTGLTKRIDRSVERVATADVLSLP